MSRDDSDQTRLLSTLLSKMGESRGYLVRIHPVMLGEGVITLPHSRVIIGRDAACDLVLSDNDISRQHVAIEFNAGEYIACDLGSTNGTLVNNTGVSKARLASGDLIRIGKTILKFLRGNDVEKQYHETVYSMMVHDGLTGIPNKRYLIEMLGRELIRSQRHHRPLTLAALDLDHFKQVNDTYGHLAGDAVLREFSARVKATIRKDELFARYGGEEFVAVLPESTLDEAALFAERIRKLVADDPVEAGGQSIVVTVSIGLACTAGEAPLTVEQLFERADAKLYEAKKAGRNRVAK